MVIYAYNNTFKYDVLIPGMYKTENNDHDIFPWLKHFRSRITIPASHRRVV